MFVMIREMMGYRLEMGAREVVGMMIMELVMRNGCRMTKE